MARRRYRMTPARKAALRKAQIASAKKRKRARVKRTAKGVAGGVLAVTMGGVGGHYTKKGVTRYKNKRAYAAFVKLATPTQRALPPGSKTTKIDYSQRRADNAVLFDENGRPRGNKNGLAQWEKGQAKWIPKHKRWMKSRSDGTVQPIKRNRVKYNAQRRGSYSPGERKLKYKNQDRPRIQRKKG
jgi:hypothetical protein